MDLIRCVLRRTIKMTKYLILLSALLCFSCSKRDPHPELKDEIYSDLLSEQDIMAKNVDAAEKELVELEKTVKSAVPQTGQSKSFYAKYFEAKNAVDKMRQQRQYFDIKVEERKLDVQSRYAESFSKNGRAWPDPAEIATYKAKLKLYRDKIAWERNRGMIKNNVPRGTEKKPAPAGEHGAEPAAAEHH